MSAHPRVLVPVDFSAASQLAIDHALRLLSGQEAEITLLHVLAHVPDLPGKFDYGRPFEVPEYRRVLQEAAQHDLDELEHQLPESVARRKTLVVTGDPADEIARIASEQDVDMIIMSTHGRRGFSHLVHGSVTEKVVRIAPCSVLCVRPKRSG